MTSRAAGSERVLPWRHTWGLAACAAFVGLVCAFAPYGNDVVSPLLCGGIAVFLITQLHGLGLGTSLPMIMYAGTMAIGVLVWFLSSIGRWLVLAAATPRAPGAAQ